MPGDLNAFLIIALGLFESQQPENTCQITVPLPPPETADILASTDSLEGGVADWAFRVVTRLLPYYPDKSALVDAMVNGPATQWVGLAEPKPSVPLRRHNTWSGGGI